MKKFLIITMCFVLASCDLFPDSVKQNVLKPLNLWEPVPVGLQMEPPKGGTPEFDQGWKDGCYSGLASYGGDHYKYLGYKFKQDWRMINNQDYYQAWQDSYLYCRWYIWNYIKKSNSGGLWF